MDKLKLAINIIRNSCDLVMLMLQTMVSHWHNIGFIKYYASELNRQNLSQNGNRIDT